MRRVAYSRDVVMLVMISNSSNQDLEWVRDFPRLKHKEDSSEGLVGTSYCRGIVVSYVQQLQRRGLVRGEFGKLGFVETD
ncbi:unnamed protein product [Arabis nemorensis]|uniref:Uncharacterized protein n=1 Tax=Arabis nemorensis TaxID=586526 RepID=A0A565BSA9_9BRAS|nr:unnamed protein product [Arabis nemorensis]